MKVQGLAYLSNKTVADKLLPSNLILKPRSSSNLMCIKLPNPIG